MEQRAGRGGRMCGSGPRRGAGSLELVLTISYSPSQARSTNSDWTCASDLAGTDPSRTIATSGAFPWAR